MGHIIYLSRTRWAKQLCISMCYRKVSATNFFFKFPHRIWPFQSQNCIKSLYTNKSKCLYELFSQIDLLFLNGAFPFLGKPNTPVISKVSCKVRNAQIQWASSHNGGAIQTFIALATIGQQTVSRSESVCDKGESKIHSTHLQNLQSSTKYAFYIVAQNKHGNSSSEKRECKTLDDGMLHYLKQNNMNIFSFLFLHHPILWRRQNHR